MTGEGRDERGEGAGQGIGWASTTTTSCIPPTSTLICSAAVVPVSRSLFFLEPNNSSQATIIPSARGVIMEEEKLGPKSVSSYLSVDLTDLDELEICSYFGQKHVLVCRSPPRPD